MQKSSKNKIKHLHFFSSPQKAPFNFDMLYEMMTGKHFKTSICDNRGVLLQSRWVILKKAIQNLVRQLLKAFNKLFQEDYKDQVKITRKTNTKILHKAETKMPERQKMDRQMFSKKEAPLVTRHKMKMWECMVKVESSVPSLSIHIWVKLIQVKQNKSSTLYL